LLSDPILFWKNDIRIRILFWLKPYYLYPKTIRKCTVMHNIHFCAVSILPFEAKQPFEAK